MIDAPSLTFLPDGTSDDDGSAFLLGGIVVLNCGGSFWTNPGLSAHKNVVYIMFACVSCAIRSIS